jgi:hypothetical protein
MRILSSATVVGSVLLIGLVGMLPAASQSVQPTQPTASLKVAAVADWKAERDAYVQKARDEVQAWQRKLLVRFQVSLSTCEICRAGRA